MHTRALQLSACLILLLFALSPARADEATPPARLQAPAPAPATPTTGDASLDFDLLGDQPKPDAATQAKDAERLAKLERQVNIRRKVLQAHQIIGFSTLALMAATVILGQVNYVARYGGLADGRDFERYQLPHLGLSVTTSAMFATLGILGVAAPNPYPKPIKADAALVHKVSMALATAGMVTQLILGPITAIYGGRIDQRELALGHVITGYATFGFMSAGVLAYVF
jgi:hypothetical protein